MASANLNMPILLRSGTLGPNLARSNNYDVSGGSSSGYADPQEVAEPQPVAAGLLPIAPQLVEPCSLSACYARKFYLSQPCVARVVCQNLLFATDVMINYF